MSDATKMLYCGKCREEILDPQFVKFGEHTFHANHFTCTNCEKDLTGVRFGEYMGQFYCAECHVAAAAKTCDYCKEKIVGSSVISAMDKFFHKDHFLCSVCSVDFPGGAFHQHEGQAFCQKHYIAASVQKCVACSDPITEGKKITINAKPFHERCVNCGFCLTPLTAETTGIFTFADSRGDPKLLCRDDYQLFTAKNCTKCGKVISGKSVDIPEEAESYHSHCFTCAKCPTTLTAYRTKLGELRCEAHEKEGGIFEEAECSAKCGKPIRGPDICIAVAGGRYHKDCVTCTSCQQVVRKADVRVLPSGAFNCAMCLEIALSTNKSKSHSVSARKNLDESRSRAKQRIASVSILPGMDELGEVQITDSGIKYTRGKVIGKGAMGTVYLGSAIETGELLAIKEMDLKAANVSEYVDLVEREIKTMKHLNHANIVRLIGTQFEDKPDGGKTYMILMEYIAGQSVFDLVATFEPLQEGQIQVYMKQLLKALSHLHSKNVVHRDIKGKNVLITPKGVVKVTDFGSAISFKSDALLQDMSLDDAEEGGQEFESTALWTSPEATQGVYHGAMDVWAAGCVVIEMATGLTPWHEKKFSSEFRALFHIQSSDEIPELPVHLSDSAKDFLRKCFTRDPVRRPSADDLLRHKWMA